MRLTSDIARGIAPGKVQDRLSKRYELEAKYLTDNSQADPIKILFGRDFLSMSLLTPIFDLVTKDSGGGGKGYSKVGGAGQVTYFGGFAGAFCAGPIDKIFAIHESDAEVETFTEGLALGDDSGSALWDSTGKYYTLTLDGYGTLRIHHGTATQPIDPRFTDDKPDIVIDIENPETSKIPTGEDFQPAYRSVFYVATDSFKLGTSNTTPNLRIEVLCTPKCFAQDYPAYFEDETQPLTVADENGDVYPPLIVYEYLRNSTWGGAGLAVSDIDHESFATATHQCIQEGIAITALQDSADITIRDAISQILQYCDGAIYLNDAGKVAIKLVRAAENTSVYPLITEAELADEPDITWDGEREAWGRTEIIFNSRDDSYESTAEVFESPRYSGAVLREMATERLSIPFCKKRLLAAKLARRFGNSGAEPSCEVTLSVLPGGNYKIGDLVRLSYPAFGVDELLLRVNKITVGGPREPLLRITAVSEPATSWEVDVETLTVGFQKSQDIVYERDGGFLKPRVLLLDNGSADWPINGTEIAMFCERNTTAPIVNYEARGMSKLSWPVDSTENRWSEAGKNKYQTEVEIVELLANTKLLTLDVKVRGEKRRDEFVELISKLQTTAAYITCCAFTSDLFEPAQVEAARTLRPMSFRIREIRQASIEHRETGNVFKYLLSVTAEQIFSNWVYPCNAPGSQHYYPSKVAYAHRLKNVENPEEVFRYRSVDFKIIHGSMDSIVWLFADFGNGVYEVSPCGFWQKYVGTTNPSHTVGASENIEERESAWGNPITISEGIIRVSTSSPVMAQGGQAENNIFWLNPVTGESKVYTENGWELVDNSNVLDPLIPPEQIPFGSAADEVARGDHLHDDRYQLIGDSAERYYRSFTSSSSLNHVRGSDGRVHVLLIDEMPITITLPSIVQAENGDMITVFFSAENDVEQNVVTFASDEDEVFANGQNEVIVGTGTILQLVCVETGWLPILKSILEI